MLWHVMGCLQAGKPVPPPRFLQHQQQDETIALWLVQTQMHVLGHPPPETGEPGRTLQLAGSLSAARAVCSHDDSLDAHCIACAPLVGSKEWEAKTALMNLSKVSSSVVKGSENPALSRCSGALEQEPA